MSLPITSSAIVPVAGATPVKVTFSAILEVTVPVAGATPVKVTTCH